MWKQKKSANDMFNDMFKFCKLMCWRKAIKENLKLGQCRHLAFQTPRLLTYLDAKFSFRRKLTPIKDKKSRRDLKKCFKIKQKLFKLELPFLTLMFLRCNLFWLFITYQISLCTAHHLKFKEYWGGGVKFKKMIKMRVVFRW